MQCTSYFTPNRLNCCSCSGDLFKRPKAASFNWNRIGDEIWQKCSLHKYISTVSRNLRFDVTILRRQPWYHLTQKSAAVWRVNTKHLCMRTYVHQFLIHSTFVGLLFMQGIGVVTSWNDYRQILWQLIESGSCTSLCPAASSHKKARIEWVQQLSRRRHF